MIHVLVLIAALALMLAAITHTAVKRLDALTQRLQVLEIIAADPLAAPQPQPLLPLTAWEQDI